MIFIKTDNGILDPKPGQTAEIERLNPFFSIGEEWTGEYSTNTPIPYTENNAQKLGYPFTYYTKRIKKKTPAALYDNSMLRGKGFLITESGKINRSNIVDSELNGYFVFGISSFFQEIQNKKLRELTLATEVWNWTSSDRFDINFGFWQRIHETWEGNDNWLVAPIRNELWDGNAETGTTDWMNKIKTAGGEIDYFFSLNNNALAPQLRFKYILEKVFTEHNYTVHFEVDDTQWEKLFMVSLVPFDWRDYTTSFVPKDEITIRLADHLPNRTITDFLVQVGLKYGWRYLINDNKRECRVVSYRNIRKGKRKDWTQYSSAEIEPEFAEEDIIFSFSNEIDSNDSYPISPSFDGFKRLPDVFSFFNLTDPTPEILGCIQYTYVENSFWRCELNDTTPVWVFHGDNIFTFDQENSNETISSTVSTLPVVSTIYRRSSGVDYYGLFPAMKHQANKDFGYRLLFYWGEVAETLQEGAFGPATYPHLSSLYNIPGTGPDGIWSNVYVHNQNGLNEKGLVKYWFREWMNLRQKNEDITLTLYLPRHELLNFEWDDIIIIQNIPYLVRSITEGIPYKDFIQATLHRMD